MDSGRIKDSNQVVEEHRRKQAPKVERKKVSFDRSTGEDDRR